MSKYLYNILLCIFSLSCHSANPIFENKNTNSFIIINFRKDQCIIHRHEINRDKYSQQLWKISISINGIKYPTKNYYYDHESLKIPVYPGNIKLEYALKSSNKCDCEYRTGGCLFDLPRLKQMYLSINNNQIINLKITNISSYNFGIGCIGGGGNPIAIPFPSHYQEVELSVFNIRYE